MKDKKGQENKTGITKQCVEIQVESEKQELGA